MTKEISEGIGAFYHHYPRIAAVITARAGGKDNAMAAAWHMPISFKPPLYGVAVSPKRFTYRQVVESKEFGINFLPASEAELVAAVGGSKGGEIDKFSVFSINKDKSFRTGAPILSAAYAAYECRLVDDKTYGDHQLLVGEIVAVHCLKEAFTADEILDLQKIAPVLYLGAERYLSVTKYTTRTLEREVYGKKG